MNADKLLKILSYPHPALTTPTKPWMFLSENPFQLLLLEEQLFQVLQNEPNGIALAANQVGIEHRMFVVKEKFSDRTGLPVLVINPKVSAGSGRAEKDKDMEGCLSFPGVKIPVVRNSSIVLEYQDMSGALFTKEFSGADARVIQHECEHLDGETFMDNLPRIQRFQLMAEMKKRKVSGKA